MLQTRTGKRTAKAALKIAVDMAGEGLITERKRSCASTRPRSTSFCTRPSIRMRRATSSPRPAGLAGCGHGRDRVHLRGAEEARRPAARSSWCGSRPARGHSRHARRRRHSHHARRHDQPRGRGRPRHGQALRLRRRGLRIDAPNGTLVSMGATLKGRRHHHRRLHRQVLQGRCRHAAAGTVRRFRPIMEWADACAHEGAHQRRNPADARARDFGAEGIGLCRTEHMFFEGDRITAMREMILADDRGRRRKALAKLLPMQREDFIELFEIMKPACRSPSACSIRRCTSSCPRPTRKSPKWPAPWASRSKLLRAARR
jgi:pyruvate,orthophosphate dikinase